MSRRLMVIAASALALLAAPALAAAQEAVPQGDPGVGAYTETVPEPDGDTSTRDNGEGGIKADDNADNAEQVLSDETEDALADQGASGAGAAALAESASPGKAKDSRDSDDSKEDRAKDDAAKADLAASDRAIDANLASEASSSDPTGLGIALPIMLVASLLLALGIRYFRRPTGS